NDRSTTLRALHNRFGLLTNDLVNEEIDAMMSIIFLTTLRQSRLVTPTIPTLPDDFVFDDIENWALTPPPPTVPRDNYEIEIHEDGLNLPITYFNNGNFSYVAQQASDVPGSFSKNGKTITSAELVDYYATNN
ncbi:7771_t:CDS:1, partial [Cetraspora pellucida]